MKNTDFEQFLDEVTRVLKLEAEATAFKTPLSFEKRIRKIINNMGGFEGQLVDTAVHPHIFPDIMIGNKGIEVKFSQKDTWRSIANSVFESTRSHSVEYIYVIFGKMGGTIDVKWARYEDSIIHVRTSHVPRFELEIGASETLFSKFGIPYTKFQKLDAHKKMEYVRVYARARMRKGERLWWLESSPDSTHSLPMQARLYTSLDNFEKRQLRAEAALLCPAIVQGSRAKHKYDDVVLYALTYRGILCHQARDLFSAGSVAGPSRGGNYIERSLQDIEKEMRKSALDLDDALFVEYWGYSCPPSERIRQWLNKADKLCKDWTPSQSLFID